MSKHSNKRLAKAVVSREYVTYGTTFDVLTTAKRRASQAMQWILHLIVTNWLIDSCIAEVMWAAEGIVMWAAEAVWAAGIL